MRSAGEFCLHASPWAPCTWRLQRRCQRGCPRHMMIDNGTNICGASRILKAEVERISSPEVEQRNPKMEFVFIPPGMGGTWERLVRSTISILFEILPSDGLREEILRAALAAILTRGRTKISSRHSVSNFLLGIYYRQFLIAYWKFSVQVIYPSRSHLYANDLRVQLHIFLCL
ncbi:hypothetical protein ACLKA6_014001 [Drosophila palustris]